MCLLLILGQLHARQKCLERGDELVARVARAGQQLKLALSARPTQRGGAHHVAQRVVDAPFNVAVGSRRHGGRSGSGGRGGDYC